MKIDSAVRRATGIIALGVLSLSALMQMIYLLVIFFSPLNFHYSFPLGNLLMGVTVILNFFLMSYGIQQAIGTGNPEEAARRIRASHTLRNLLLLVVLVIAFIFRRHFNLISTCVTIAFPQISVYLSRLFLKGAKEEGDPIETTCEEPDTMPEAIEEAAPPLPDGGEEDHG